MAEPLGAADARKRAPLTDTLCTTMTDREEDLTAMVVAMTKSVASLAPVVGQAIAGYDAYRRSIHDRNIRRMLGYLYDRVGSLEVFLSEEWLHSEEGEIFFRKVVDAAIDVQSEEKQQLFVNVLVNGTRSAIPLVEKTKFVDMLRGLSLSSVQVLAELHKRFIGQTRGPGRPDPTAAFPIVKPNDLAEELSEEGYDPYVVISSIKELESIGLFSNTGDFRKQGSRFVSAGGFQSELSYTDFSARFAEFISDGA